MAALVRAPVVLLEVRLALDPELGFVMKRRPGGGWDSNGSPTLIRPLPTMFALRARPFHLKP